MKPGGIRPMQVALLSVAIGAFFTTQIVFQSLAAGRPVSFERDIVQEQLYWLTWAALSPLIVMVVRRWPLDGVVMRRAVARHLAVSAVLVPVQSVLAFTLDYAYLAIRGIAPDVSLVGWLAARLGLLVWGVFMGAMFYWVIVGFYTVFYLRRLYAAEQLSGTELARRGALLQAELTRAQLDALRAQLRPHFLFNTLNAIAVLTADEPARARQMLIRLGSLLRRSLDEERHEVALEQELAYLHEYLDIQRARFGDRLAITESVDPAVAAIPVPVFLLQPLVENAIVHGAAERDGVTRIEVRAEAVGSVLRISVMDNGPGVAAGARGHRGIGLRNTRDRLAQLYGGAGTLGLANRGDTTGAAAVVTIPLRPVS